MFNLILLAITALQREGPPVRTKLYASLNSANNCLQDFESSGVFAAQTALEAVQKAEEDRLYAEIRAERQRRVRRLEEELQQEMECTVSDLVTTFERWVKATCRNYPRP